MENTTQSPDYKFFGDLQHYSNIDFTMLIDCKYGWAVGKQAEAILDGERYEDQNPNALKYIAEFATSRKETELAESINSFLNQQ